MALTKALTRHDAAAVRARLIALAAHVPGTRRIAVYDNARHLDRERWGARCGGARGGRARARRTARRVGRGVGHHRRADYAREGEAPHGPRGTRGGRGATAGLDARGERPGHAAVGGHDDRRARVPRALRPLSDPMGQRLVEVGVFQDRDGARERDLAPAARHRRRSSPCSWCSPSCPRSSSSGPSSARSTKFLAAARRLARGDFSRPVPIEGGDEFAALGREFNMMSEQLASKIAEVQRKRGELEDTIRRVGRGVRRRPRPSGDGEHRRAHSRGGVPVRGGPRAPARPAPDEGRVRRQGHAPSSRRR